MDKYLEVLRKTKLLSTLNDADILSALTCLQARVKTFQKGSVIFSEGDKVNYVGIILHGELETQKIDYKGNTNIISKLYATDLIAAAAVYSSGKTLPFDVVCISDSEVLFLDYASLIRPCCKACLFHTKIIENMLTAIADKNLQLTNKIDILLKRTTREKVLAYLYSLSKKAKSAKFAVPLTRRQMAEYLSVNRSALSRELCNMQNEGIISFNNNIFQLK